MPFYGKNVAPDWVKDEYPLSSDGKGYFVDCGLFPEAQFTPDGGQVVTNPDGSTLTRTRQEVWRGTSLEGSPAIEPHMKYTGTNHSGCIQKAEDGTLFVARSDVDRALHDIAILAREGVPVAIERGVPGKKVYDLVIVAAPCGVHPFPSDADFYDASSRS